MLPDPDNRFTRARTGEIGLVEGWQLARAVQEVVAEDRALPVKRPIVAVIDVASQAYGRREEAYGIHQALAGAAGAYAEARLAGHPVIGLIVGKAMSGAFLAHGYQANRLIAFDDPQVMVHAMGKASAARITLRTVEALEALAATMPPMAYDIGNYASAGPVVADLDGGAARCAVQRGCGAGGGQPERGAGRYPRLTPNAAWPAGWARRIGRRRPRSGRCWRSSGR